MREFLRIVGNIISSRDAKYSMCTGMLSNVVEDEVPSLDDQQAGVRGRKTR